MTDEKKSNRQQQEEWDYIGNIWGWKFSFLGLVVIVLLVAFMRYRYVNLEDKPDNIFTPIHKTSADSLKTTN